MPIKFRCSYCRQFLGISRDRAGGLVDCPTCGRTIRVPGLDGHVKPLPKPEMDLEDPRLARALDELATLGETPAAARAGQSDGEDAIEVEPEAEIPQPLPEPVPLELPLPPEPVVRSVAPLPMPSSPVATADVDPLRVATELEELAAPPRETAAAPLPLSSAPSAPVQPRRRRLPMILLVLLVAALVGLSFLAGRHFDGPTAANPLSEDDPAAPQQQPEPPPPPAAQGRITYKTAAGDSLPDRGARILVFPPERTGTVRLSVVGFRPADNVADFEIAAAGLRALGGAAATADDDGNFEIELPAAGRYRILVLSHFQERDDGAIESELQQLLAAYFDRPDQLLGRLDYEFGQLRHQGTGTQTWDHSF